MRAVIAFRRRMLVRVHIKRVVRAGLRAGFAADAAARVKINDSVFSRKKRRHRADFDARRVGAVVAAHYGKKPSRVGESSLFDVFHPRSINTDRNLVFRFARDRAGMTADTFAVIYDETKVHIKFIFAADFD